MKEDPTKPIPVSPKVLWGQVRYRILPLVVFLVLVGVSAHLWQGMYSSPGLQGIAEGTRSTLTSPVPGIIQEIVVRPYQLVNEGDVIAVIRAVDPRLSLDLLQAELELARLRHEPAIAQRNAMDFQRVRVDLLRLREELAVAKIQLQRAENEVARNASLFEGRLLSEDLYDLSLKTRDALQATVHEKTRSVADLEQTLESLRDLGDPVLASTNDTGLAWLDRLERSYTDSGTNWSTIVLCAPISGMVTPAVRNEGEYVLNGEAIIGVNSMWSERVVAYLRQPYPVDPRVGMEVLVSTRSHKRQQFSVPIAHVGAQVEPITNILAYIRQGALVDVGLPIILNLPPNNTVRPGEIVDIRIAPAAPSEEALN